MGATYSKYKTWAADEVVTTPELNQQFDNERANLNPPGVDDYSASQAQMRLQTDPGAAGTESLATSLAGELERLRFALNRLIGGTYWYDAPALDFNSVATILGTTQVTPDNRVVSGRVRATSQQPIYLVPNGANLNVTLKASVTPLVCYINGTKKTLNADVSVTLLAAALGAANQVTLSWDGSFIGSTGQGGNTVPQNAYNGESDQGFYRYLPGVYGATITNQNGTYVTLRNPTNLEYFLCYLEPTANAGISRALRGYFFDSADAPITRKAMAFGAVCEAMRTGWIFLLDNLTLDVSYSNPKYAPVAPSGAAGDYWYNTITNRWSKHNGISFVDTPSVFVGIAVADGTACVGARSADFFKYRDEFSAAPIEYFSSSVVRTATSVAGANVEGHFLDFGRNVLTWDTAADLETGAVAANTYYYVYLTENGQRVISVEKPYEKPAALRGYYHPYHTWRAFGSFRTDAGALIVPGSVLSYGEASRPLIGDRSLSVSKMPLRPTGTDSSGFGNHILDSFDAIMTRTLVFNSTVTSVLTAAAQNLGSTQIRCSGRPVKIKLAALPNGVSQPSGVGIDSGTTLTSVTAIFWFFRDGTLIGTSMIRIDQAAGAKSYRYPPNVVEFEDLASTPGLHTYGIGFGVVAATNGCQAVVGPNVQLQVSET